MAALSLSLYTMFICNCYYYGLLRIICYTHVSISFRFEAISRSLCIYFIQVNVMGTYYVL